jgi:hypothetical protein
VDLWEQGESETTLEVDDALHIQGVFRLSMQAAAILEEIPFLLNYFFTFGMAGSLG